MAGSIKTNKWLEFVLATVCFLTPMVVVVPWSKLEQSNDFAKCYAASYLMHSDAYRLIYNANVFAPPVIGWIFSPLSYLKLKMALYAWIAIAIIAMFVSCLVICQSLGIKGSKKLWVFAFFGALGPCVMSVWHEQLLPFILFALTGLYISLKKRRFIYASIYQFLLWLKPYILFPIMISELAAGQTNLVVISFLLAVIGVLISCVRGGTSILWNYWQLCLSQKLDTPLLSLLQAFAVPNHILVSAWQLDLYRSITTVLYGALLVIAFFAGKEIKAKKLPLSILFTFIVPLTLCLFSSILPYDLLLIAPAILLVVVSQPQGWRKYLKAILVLVILAVLILPDYLAIFSLGIFRNTVFSPFFWATLAFSIGSLIIKRQSVGGHADVHDS